CCRVGVEATYNSPAEHRHRARTRIYCPAQRLRVEGVRSLCGPCCIASTVIRDYSLNDRSLNRKRRRSCPFVVPPSGGKGKEPARGNQSTNRLKAELRTMWAAYRLCETVGVSIRFRAAFWVRGRINRCQRSQQRHLKSSAVRSSRLPALDRMTRAW